MGRNAHRVVGFSGQSQLYLPRSPPWQVKVPARPADQTALSAARNLQTMSRSFAVQRQAGSAL
eukprot:14173133-Alexandrium_andersonii.AAC.1